LRGAAGIVGNSWRRKRALARIGDQMKIEEVAKISKALGDQTRLHIFELIASRKETPCGKLAGVEKVTPATISHHLKILLEAGLIECRREGQFVFNRVNAGRVREYTRSLGRLSRGK
jgi:ArsR family transcriptional regulator, arsenate/arsenite/antimonite-responsive transcriptional repressor